MSRNPNDHDPEEEPGIWPDEYAGDDTDAHVPVEVSEAFEALEAKEAGL